MVTVMEYMMYRGDLNVRVEHLINAHSMHGSIDSYAGMKSAFDIS